MAWIVQTEEGVVAQKAVDDKRPLTQEVAEASAQERNARAEEMGLKVRYEAVER